MLPLRPRRAAERVDRARFDGDRDALPFRPLPCAESARRGREQREADHGIEDRPVAAQAEARAFAIADQQGLLERVGDKAGEGRGAGANGKQPAGTVGLRRAGAVEPVGPAERHRLALAEEALKLERPEGEGGDMPGQSASSPG